VQLDASHPDLKATIHAPDEVSVDVPAFANQGPNLGLTFRDPTGCTSNISVPASCP
jgi:hypothetical protein